MNKPTTGRPETYRTVRNFIIFLTAVGLAGGAAFLFFIKGLYLLPEKVCAGAAQRDLAIQTLPRARAADEWSDQRGTGRNFSFACRISTSGNSILSGQVDLRNSSKASWVDFYGDAASRQVIRISEGDLGALAQLDGDSVSASVYLPCVPTGIEEGDESKPYALVADASVTGKSRATEAELRQALTDFAYQLTKHAYKLADCKTPRDFPEKLPRYQNNR
ncbi:hypothetical protein [Streptomyces sp. NBC_00076]|uniref:hypothetical protein n=1 Tax=Streptomyces sp. NBC_00076 TaxID=2975642 RepID=UPI0032487C1A